MAITLFINGVEFKSLKAARAFLAQRVEELAAIAASPTQHPSAEDVEFFRALCEQHYPNFSSRIGDGRIVSFSASRTRAMTPQLSVIVERERKTTINGAVFQRTEVCTIPLVNALFFTNVTKLNATATAELDEALRNAVKFQILHYRNLHVSDADDINNRLQVRYRAPITLESLRDAWLAHREIEPSLILLRRGGGGVVPTIDDAEIEADWARYHNVYAEYEIFHTPLFPPSAPSSPAMFSAEKNFLSPRANANSKRQRI